MAARNETAETPATDFVPPTTWNTTEALRLDGDAVEKLARLGAEATGVTPVVVALDGEDNGLPSSFPLAVIHGEHPRLESVKALAEQWRTQPARRRGVAMTGSLGSFIELVNRQKTENSAVFADSDWTRPSFTAVIDYHDLEGGGLADNGTHRVRYEFPLSEEWKQWVANNGRKMDQGEFAEFIEDRIADLTAAEDATKIWLERDFQTSIATPSQLIQLSRGLQVNVESRVKNNVTLQSGEGQIVFEESHTGADGQPVKVPGLFVLNVSPFFMGEPIEIPVRLRYRVTGGKLIWFYQIYRPDQSITQAVRHAMGDVRNGTDLPVYEGSPEMAANGAIVGS